MQAKCENLDLAYSKKPVHIQQNQYGIAAPERSATLQQARVLGFGPRSFVIRVRRRRAVVEKMSCAHRRGDLLKLQGSLAEVEAV